MDIMLCVIVGSKSFFSAIDPRLVQPSRTSRTSVLVHGHLAVRIFLLLLFLDAKSEC